MLRKLMKHEFRATRRVMLPLFLVVLLTSAGANLSARVLTEVDNMFLNILGVLLIIAFVLAIISVCLVAFVMMLQRFYQNLLQDEGYVMMTLPVSVHQHIWSKLLVSMIWFVTTGLVISAAFGILVYEVGFVKQLFLWLGQLLGSIRFDSVTVHGAVFTAEMLALAFLTCAGACLQFFAALAIGHSFARRKMLMSIVTYFGFQFILQMLGGVFIALMSMVDLDYVIDQTVMVLSNFGTGHFVMVSLIVFMGIFAAIFYLPTAYFLKKRLNLE